MVIYRVVSWSGASGRLLSDGGGFDSHTARMNNIKQKVEAVLRNGFSHLKDHYRNGEDCPLVEVRATSDGLYFVSIRLGMNAKLDDLQSVSRRLHSSVDRVAIKNVSITPGNTCTGSCCSDSFAFLELESCDLGSVVYNTDFYRKSA